MRIPLALGLLAALLVAFPSSAQPAAAGPIVSVVSAGDAQQGLALQFYGAATLAFADSNGNGQADGQAPQEAVYLDLDGTHSATYADVRLTPLLGYPAGSLVDAANADAGRSLRVAPGWFASAANGAWYVDADGSHAVSAGDVRLTSNVGSRVAPGDADAGTALSQAQANVAVSNRVGFADANGDGVHQATEPIVLDLDASGGAGAGHLSPGDVRLRLAGFGVDDSVTHAE